MMPSAALQEVLRSQWLANSLQAWLIAAITAVGIFAVFALIRSAAISRVGKLAERTTNSLDDMVVGVIQQTRIFVLLLLAIYVATLPLDLGSLEPYLHTAAKLVFLWQAALWGSAAVGFWVMTFLNSE